MRLLPSLLSSLLPSLPFLLLLLPSSQAAGYSWGATTKLGSTGVIISPSSSSNCTCTSAASCAPENVITDGSGLIDLRAGPRACTAEQVCCTNPLSATTPTPPAPLTDECGVSSPLVTQLTLNSPYRSSRRGTTKIMNTAPVDGLAYQGEFPWMVAVLDSATGQLLCGGTLVDVGVVLTAAHCVAGKAPASLTARVGEWDASTTAEAWPSMDIVTRDVVIHPGYYSPGVFNDVALLLLTALADTSQPHIGVSCLPLTGDTFHTSDCMVLGWGKDNFNAAGISAVLRKTQVPLVPHVQCEAALKAARLGPRFRLHESFLCAGGQPGQDACTGDGGGPLLCPLGGEQERWIQVGVVSWGLGCGGAVPGVYADIQRLGPWIEAEITKESLRQKRVVFAA